MIVPQTARKGRFPATAVNHGNGAPIALYSGGKYYYYMTNSRGDVVALFDSTGKELARYGYDAWGNCRVTTPTGAALTSATHIANINPLRYRGYYLDTDSGLYYLQSRYYDSITHRFLNADTEEILGIQDDLCDKNLFAYCDNNPIIRIDDGGEIWHVVAAAAVGALISGISDAAIQITTSGKWDWKQTLIATGAGALSGACSMIPGGAILTTALSVGVNSALGAGAYAATEALNGRKIEGKALIASAVSGGIGGFVGAKVRVKSTTARGIAARNTIAKGTRKVSNGIRSSSKSTIKRGYSYLDKGYSMRNKYDGRVGVNSGMGSTTSMLAYTGYYYYSRQTTKVYSGYDYYIRRS